MDVLLIGAKWAEVDLEAIRCNYREVRSCLQEGTKILGVVKADAYGLGALEVSRVLENLGVDMLGVTTVEEGGELRLGGITAPILVLGPYLKEEVPGIVEWGLTPNVASFEVMAWLQEEAERGGKDIKIHLKVETGMGRLGFFPEECPSCARVLKDCSRLIPEGVYTHLATAVSPNKIYAENQLRLFIKAVKMLEEAGMSGLIRHISNSAAILNLPHMQLDMVRVGTLLYGQYPIPGLAGRLKLRDPWCFKARVSYVKELPPRHGVGYGRTFVTRTPTRVAVLSVGYVDGFQVEPVLRPASFGDALKGMVKTFLHYIGWKGLAVPVVFPRGQGRIIGKVGMQLTMVDVTGINGVEPGTIAILPLRRTSASAAIPRIYMQGKESAGNY